MSRGIAFTSHAWGDYLYWQGQDKKTLKRINLLIDAAKRDPFEGIGKPEPLLGNLSGYWSRRIDDVHRLVYAVDDVELTVIACRGHSNKRLKRPSWMQWGFFDAVCGGCRGREVGGQRSHPADGGASKLSPNAGAQNLLARFNHACEPVTPPSN